MLHSNKRPLSEEVSYLIREIRRLLRLEIKLARTEFSPKLARLGRNVACIVSGSVIVCIGFLAFATSAIMGLSKAIPPWLAAFVSGVFFTAVGALMMVRGKQGIDRETITPEKTVASLKESVQMVKDELK